MIRFLRSNCQSPNYTLTPMYNLEIFYLTYLCNLLPLTKPILVEIKLSGCSIDKISRSFPLSSSS